MKTGSIINMVKSNVPPDHVVAKNTSDRYIYDVLVSIRAKLLSQEYKRYGKVSEWNYSILNCVELIRVPKIQCSCLSHLSCEEIWRTKHKLPKPLTKRGKDMVSWVRTLEDRKITIQEKTDIEYAKGNRYTGNSKEAKGVFEDGHIFFYNKEMPRVIRIKMLAQKMDEVDEFKDYCNDNDCDQPCIDCEEENDYDDTLYGKCQSMYDREFDIDEDLIDPLVSLARERVYNIGSRYRKGRHNYRDNQQQQEDEQE